MSDAREVIAEAICDLEDDDLCFHGYSESGKNSFRKQADAVLAALAEAGFVIIGPRPKLTPLSEEALREFHPTCAQCGMSEFMCRLCGCPSPPQEKQST